MPDESELRYLRRASDEQLREYTKHNAEAINAMRQEIRQLYTELQQGNAKLMLLENQQAQIALKAARDATRDTLAMFGLSPDDPAEIEELRTTLRFGRGIRRTIAQLLTVGLTVIVSLVVGIVAWKLGLRSPGE